MVPTQYLVPDLTEKKNTLEAQEKTLITDFEPHQLDLSAHLVTNEVREWAYFELECRTGGSGCRIRHIILAVPLLFCAKK